MVLCPWQTDGVLFASLHPHVLNPLDKFIVRDLLGFCCYTCGCPIQPTFSLPPHLLSWCFADDPYDRLMGSCLLLCTHMCWRIWKQFLTLPAPSEKLWIFSLWGSPLCLLLIVHAIGIIIVILIKLPGWTDSPQNPNHHCRHQKMRHYQKVFQNDVEVIPTWSWGYWHRKPCCCLEPHPVFRNRGEYVKWTNTAML